MAKGDWLPKSDDGLQHWLQNFYNTLVGLLGQLNLPGNILNPVSAAKNDWDAKYPAHLTAQQAALTATTDKDVSRAALEGALRTFVAFLQAWPALTDPMRTALGLRIRDKILTSSQGVPVSIQADAVILATTGRHEIWFFLKGKKKGSAKPAGMKACEIRVALTAADADAPTNFDAYSFLALDTAAPYLALYGSADGGKTAHYIFRWISTADVPGPWSDPVSATIPKI